MNLRDVIRRKDSLAALSHYAKCLDQLMPNLVCLTSLVNLGTTTKTSIEVMLNGVNVGSKSGVTLYSSQNLARFDIIDYVL